VGLVSLSSVAGRTGRLGNAVYAATKWGIDGWPESLRQELQPGARVMVIEFGAVAAELTTHHPPRGQARTARYAHARVAAGPGGLLHHFRR